MATTRSGSGLVTGGGTGVGRAIALALAVPVDVTDDAAVAPAVKQVQAELGPVDVLVNNAGHGGTAARLADGDVGPLRAVLAVDVVAPAVLCSLVLPGMVARGSGHALNITSLQGSWTFPGYTAYGEQWTPAERVAEKAAALVSGRYDVLTGRFVHAEDDLDALVASLPADDGDARRLRLTAVPGGDPVLG